TDVTSFGEASAMGASGSEPHAAEDAKNTIARWILFIKPLLSAAAREPSDRRFVECAPQLKRLGIDGADHRPREHLSEAHDVDVSRSLVRMVSFRLAPVR